MASDQTAVRDSYDSAARAYADHLFHELDGKPLDRHLLNRLAEELAGEGLVADLGCGPGHVARYLNERGVAVVGVDLSSEMIRVATERSPSLDFRVGDMTRLEFGDETLAGVVAFYSIVHFDLGAIGGFAREVSRVLRTGGLAVVAFHVGDDTIHVDDLFGAPVSLDFRFHDPEAVIERFVSAGMRLIERIAREPYEGVEYETRRCYLVFRR